MAKITETTAVTKIVLELSVAEARTLYALSIRAGGDPLKSPRKHADNINEEFRNIFGPWEDLPEFQLSADHTAHFSDYPSER